MLRLCGYCKRRFNATNYNQIYCCQSCKNCAHSSARLLSSDDKKLMAASGYYATQDGKAEVIKGLHDKTLQGLGLSRSDWLDLWSKKWGKVSSPPNGDRH